MNFHTRKWIKPQDLNPNQTLFGGRLLEWIDEECALYSIIQLENPKTVTKYMSEIDFRSSAREGDIIEIGIEVVKFGSAFVKNNSLISLLKASYWKLRRPQAFQYH